MLTQILEILNLFLVIIISNSSYLFIGWFSSDELFLVRPYSMENMLLNLSDNMSRNARNTIYSDIIHFANVPSVNGDFASSIAKFYLLKRKVSIFCFKCSRNLYVYSMLRVVE